MSTKFVNWLFCLTIVLVPIGQAVWERSQGEPIQALDVFGPIKEPRFRQFEEALRENSFIVETALPYYQWTMTSWLGRGNAKVLQGDNDWLYYEDDLNLVSLPGFLEGRYGSRAVVDAIVDFRDQLLRKDVQMILVPVPPKGMFDPSHVGPSAQGIDVAANPDTDNFFAALRDAGVNVLDVPALMSRMIAGGAGDLYMARDTHWRPETMQRVGRELAAEVRKVLGVEAGAPLTDRRFEAESAVQEGLGDLVDILGLPQDAQPFETMRLDVSRVRDAATGEFFAPETGADILILGDSFTRIFADDRLGLGEHAGLAEHLALELGSPLDVIAIPGGAARAVRETLARRPAGVAGKRLVIWQFSMRDLVAEREKWEKVDLSGKQGAGPAQLEPLEVVAELAQITQAKEFMYAKCMGIFEYRVVDVISGQHAGGPLWVAHLVWNDFAFTPAASFKVGDVHHLKLEDVELHNSLERNAHIWDMDFGAAVYFALDWQ